MRGRKLIMPSLTHHLNWKVHSTFCRRDTDIHPFSRGCIFILGILQWCQELGFFHVQSGFSKKMKATLREEIHGISVVCPLAKHPCTSLLLIMPWDSWVSSIWGKWGQTLRVLSSSTRPDPKLTSEKAFPPPPPLLPTFWKFWVTSLELKNVWWGTLSLLLNYLQTCSA